MTGGFAFDKAVDEVLLGRCDACVALGVSMETSVRSAEHMDMTMRAVGDRSEVLEKRESKSKENIGIVTVKTTGFNQDGTVVITFKRTVMVYRRGHAPEIPRPAPENDER